MSGVKTPVMLVFAGFCSTTTGLRLLMEGISNLVAAKYRVFWGEHEDFSSAVMQTWGFDNFNP